LQHGVLNTTLPFAGNRKKAQAASVSALACFGFFEMDDMIPSGAVFQFAAEQLVDIAVVDWVADDILVRADKNYRRYFSAFVAQRRLRVHEYGVEPKAKKRKRFLCFVLQVRWIIPQPLHVKDHHINAKSTYKQMMQRVKDVLPCVIEQRQLDGLAAFRVPNNTVKKQLTRRNGSMRTS
jgi:hypothetical protein